MGTVKLKVFTYDGVYIVYIPVDGLEYRVCFTDGQWTITGSRRSKSREWVKVNLSPALREALIDRTKKLIAVARLTGEILT